MRNHPDLVIIVKVWSRIHSLISVPVYSSVLLPIFHAYRCPIRPSILDNFVHTPSKKEEKRLYRTIALHVYKSLHNAEEVLWLPIKLMTCKITWLTSQKWYTLSVLFLRPQKYYDTWPTVYYNIICKGTTLCCHTSVCRITHCPELAIFFFQERGQTKQKKKRKTHGHTHAYQETTSLPCLIILHRVKPCNKRQSNRKFVQ